MCGGGCGDVLGVPPWAPSVLFDNELAFFRTFSGLTSACACACACGEAAQTKPPPPRLASIFRKRSFSRRCAAKDRAVSGFPTGKNGRLRTHDVDDTERGEEQADRNRHEAVRL